ncbi:3-oxo-5-alpha-steroid 4-dehydrogenase-domain-containing protein [Amylocystis lapponica]|nr:3-oxo-5-alpha-steroid 4-dehydrogenase-domain-containing protein [Amylocystis lapponica]
MVSVTVSAAGRVPLARGLPIIIDLDKTTEGATVADVKAAIAAKFPRFYTARQRVCPKGEKKPLSDETSLQDAGVADGGELTVKDMGPQVNWQTVFLVEYTGPLFIHPIFYYFPKLFYGGSVQHSMLQEYVYTLVMLHFIKRLLETVFVHRFSHGTMPFSNLIRNAAHYWFLSGLFLAFPIYSPAYSASSPHILGTRRNEPSFLLGGIALWLFAELSNLHCHLALRALRPPGTKARAIPYGYGFALVSCPNYFFETLSWVTIATMTGSYSAWLFVAVGTWIMIVWAQKKHKAYKKEFGKAYPQNRTSIFPFIL